MVRIPATFVYHDNEGGAVDFDLGYDRWHYKLRISYERRGNRSATMSRDLSLPPDTNLLG